MKCSEDDDGDENETNGLKFKFAASNGLLFESLEDGSINCGKCKNNYLRIISHLKNSCKKAIPDNELERIQLEVKKFHKSKYQKTWLNKAKHNHSKQYEQSKQSHQKKWEEKIKSEAPEKFKEGKKVHQKKWKEKINSEAPEKLKEGQKIHQNKWKEKIKSEAPGKLKEGKKIRQKNWKDKVKSEAPGKFEESKKIHQRKWKDRMKSEIPENFKEMKNKTNCKHYTKKKMEIKRQRKNVGSYDRLQRFKRATRYGPIFVCSSCHQKLFEYEVVQLEQSLEDEVNENHDGAFSKYVDEKIPVCIVIKEKGMITERKSHYICKCCKNYLRKGKMPKLSKENGLKVDSIPAHIHQLTELEVNLIAKNIIFQKYHKKPKSRWHGTHDRLVNVPIHDQDILNTVEKLPRTPSEAGIVTMPVTANLKRKMEYKNTHIQQLINPANIYIFLKFLKQSGHPGYQFFSSKSAFEERCEKDDPFGFNLMYPEYEYLEQPPNKGSEQIDDEFEEELIKGEPYESENEEVEQYEEEYRTKDPIRKYQFDYDGSTSMVPKFPEAGSHENNNETLSFAPGEGKIPTNILKEKDWDINSFPHLFPSGQNKMYQDRKVELTPQNFIGQRLKNKDTQFEQCTPYVFACAALLEERQMERNIGVSYSKGKLAGTEETNRNYHLDDAFGVMDNVKNTPRYHKKNKMEMLAKLDNFGPFHLFFTLSCGDMRWMENFTSILKEKGWVIIWDFEDKSEDEVLDVAVKVQLQDGSIKSLETFLEEDADESIHEYIRTNVFTATRNFVNRVNCFKRDIMMGINNPMSIKKYSWKVEFQGRGAGHIHGTLWCDLEKVMDSNCYLHGESQQKSLENLEQAFKSLRQKGELSGEEEHALINFAEMFTTCTLNCEKAAEHLRMEENTKEEGRKIIQIVEQCQVHHHTKTCRKGGANNCRFNFPKYPMWKTVLAGGVSGDTPEDKEEKIARNHTILRRVQEILESEDNIESILNDYNLEEENKDDYEMNRKERIKRVLDEAGVNIQEYESAIKESSKRGVTVILARDITETMINNYNGEWIRAWNANLDLQVCLDFFSIITYITEYFTKVNNLNFLLYPFHSKNLSIIL